MRTATFAAMLLVFGVCPTQAQFGGGGLPATPLIDPAEAKLLQIEQDTDETLLREALLALGKRELRRPSERGSKAEEQAATDALNEFIQAKKVAIIERAAKMNPKPAVAKVANRPANPADPAKSEEIERLKVQVQLLQAQVSYSQQGLAEAIDNLAKAEVATDDEEGHKDKVDTARKKFEAIQAKHVEFSKRLKDEFGKLTELNPQSAYGFGGMGGIGGGGMGGIGGMQ
ncbi:hypothetical protein TA3x_001979 [Tundrisphaera sp. TA3]|uniref:hypothetical protein n=1 Tax=Tundrisphaera sp. TA3 TaxID=3435775 RepID=UPI003EC10CBF